jgi:hypothetical protein
LDARKTKTRAIGGYDYMREGLKGISIFIIFYLPINVLIERSGYMSFLGKSMWFLISK